MTYEGAATSQYHIGTMSKRMFATFPNLALFVGLILVLCPINAVSSQEVEPIDFPPLLDSDDIRYYSETHDIDGLHWALSNVFRRSSRNPNADEIVYDLPPALVSKGGGNTVSKNGDQGSRQVYSKFSIVQYFPSLFASTCITCRFLSSNW